LVSYSRKHNEENAEGNRDGDDHTYSANYGVEGPTRRRNIESLRERQIKNILATLLLSQGVPMILAGDECRRTQRGNNNAYGQDNELSWFDWSLAEKNADLVRFCQTLIEFRRDEPAVRRAKFLHGRRELEHGLPDVAWYGPDGNGVDWHFGGLSLICLFGAVPPKDTAPKDAASKGK